MNSWGPLKAWHLIQRSPLRPKNAQPGGVSIASTVACEATAAPHAGQHGA